MEKARRLKKKKKKKKTECNKTTRWRIKWLWFSHITEVNPHGYHAVKILLKWDSWTHEVDISGMFVPSLELSDSWSHDTDRWFALNCGFSHLTHHTLLSWFALNCGFSHLTHHGNAVVEILMKSDRNHEVSQFTYVRSELELSDSVTLTGDSRWIITLIWRLVIEMCVSCKWKLCVVNEVKFV